MTTTQATKADISSEEADASQGATAEASQAKAEAAAHKSALRELLAPVRTRTTIAMVMQVIAAVAAIVPYVAIAELGKTLIVGGDIDSSRVWTIVWVVVFGLGMRAFFGGGALIVTHFADVNLQAVLRRRIAATLGRLPLGWFTSHSSGTVRKAAQNDISDLHYLVAHSAVETTGAIAVPLVGLGYVISIDWRLGLVAIATLPIYMIAYAMMTKDMAVKLSRMNEGIAAISNTIVEFVTGIAVVKTFGQDKQSHSRYRDAAKAFAVSYEGWVRPMLRTEALASIALSAPVVLVVNLGLGSWFVHSGWVSPIDVLTSSLVAMVIPVSLTTIGFGMQARREAAAAAARLIALFATDALPETDHPKKPVGNEVRFSGVSFAYDDGADVLTGIDLTLPEGTVTALVGPSGSGKSTLATLVPRFHDVRAGSVAIGGVDVREVATDELYRHVGFVLQDVQLVEATVLDNIRLARPQATSAEVKAAAAAAQIDTRIEALPRGYDSVVGVDARFSGGEAQRVSIARAILADTPVLVLDEATAFADPESEADIQEALSRLTVGRTVLVIAHRLASIVSADQIVVLDAGRIVEKGTHDQLVASGSTYARMWASHSRADSIEHSRADSIEHSRADSIERNTAGKSDAAGKANS
ncbi:MULTISPECIES: ABC transporter ATP-binding protein [Rhodococcus]|nr:MULTISPECIES: ABC transporter ATP-binding protein [Rhodococcus erythropolis group]MCT6730650.1 ABC transporter ATP-binding protein/permease [Rhodococcus qingshengii]MDJ0430481.1 ABC transporter ATP-binding protein [Rhodococcus qingshengii]